MPNQMERPAKTGNQRSPRSVIRAACLVLLAVALGSLAVPAQPCVRDRAMWIYQCPYDVVRDPAERDAVFEFALGQGIKEFFLSVSFTCPSDDACSLEGSSYRDALRLVLRKAHNRGIRVHALYDDSRLARLENHNKARALVRAVLDFNGRGEADQRFDGLHLDVEPHTLSEYRTDPIDTLRQFLDMNAAVVSELAGQDLSYGVDIPDIWYPFRDRLGQLDARCDLLMDYGGRKDYPAMHLMNMVKAVTIMSYHGDADTIRRKTKYALDYAAEVGTKVYIGVQTSPAEPDLRCPSARERSCSDTFGCGTRSDMEEALCTLDQVFAGFDSFLGFSYFKYSSLRDMAE